MTQELHYYTLEQIMYCSEYICFHLWATLLHNTLPGDVQSEMHILRRNIHNTPQPYNDKHITGTGEGRKWYPSLAVSFCQKFG